jgi:nitrate/nitrite-specific signal transduction histidine kinase
VVVLRNGNSGGTPVLLICVSDSGRGFDPQDDDFRRFAAEGHFGIRNMFERAAIVGGKLTIDSESGEGATISLEVPLVHSDNYLTNVGGGGKWTLFY